MHIHKQAFNFSEKKITDSLIYCILSNGEVIKYHKFISVVVIELSARCLNTGPEDRLGERLYWFLGQIRSELWFPWQQVIMGKILRAL